MLQTFSVLRERKEASNSSDHAVYSLDTLNKLQPVTIGDKGKLEGFFSWPFIHRSLAIHFHGHSFSWPFIFMATHFHGHSLSWPFNFMAIHFHGHSFILPSSLPATVDVDLCLGSFEYCTISKGREEMEMLQVACISHRYCRRIV